MNYEKNPDRIYQKSFSVVRGEANLARFPDDAVHIAERIVHACGMPDIADELCFSPGFAKAGREALNASAPLLCDSNMTASGITHRWLRQNNEVVTPRFGPELAAKAKKLGTTQSAMAVSAWAPKLADAVTVIGNAPTALFRLLELLDEGAPPPALILAFPVGFVGAAESKDELMANSRGVEFLTLPGRRGGSAMAAAAVNALLAGAAESFPQPQEHSRRVLP